MSFSEHCKRQEFLEKSKCIFGNDTFCYDKLPKKIDTCSRIEVVCNKCKTSTERTYRQHIVQFDQFLACKNCKIKHHSYNSNDTKEEKERKVNEIRKELEVIKEKYRKIREDEKQELTIIKKGIEKRYINMLSSNESEELITYLKDNGFLPDINIEKAIIYSIAKGIIQFNTLHNIVN